VRFLKFFAITLVSLSIIFSIIYSARISIINKVLAEQVSEIGIKITCLNISFTTDMSIIIDKLCLQSAKADIDVADMLVQWQISSTNTYINITHVDISSVTITGKEHLFSNTSPLYNQKNQQNQQNQNNQALSLLLSTMLTTYSEQIKQTQQFLLSIKLNISKLSYFPFISRNNTEIADESPYTASLSTIDNRIALAFQNAKNVAFINMNLTARQDDFSIALTSELRPLKNFVSAHRLPISETLQNNLKRVDISGEIDSLITYQASLPNSLCMQNRITNLSLDIKEGIGKSGAFKLLGNLNFTSQLALFSNEKSHDGYTEIALKFLDENALSLEYSQVQLLAMLKASEVSSEIISLVEDNPLTPLTLRLQGTTALRLNDKALKEITLNDKTLAPNSVNVSHLEISAQSDEREHKIVLDNLTFDLASDTAKNTLVIERFVLDSQLNVSSLKSIAAHTSEPVTLHLTGSLNHADKATTLSLLASSLISLKNIAITSATDKKITTLLTTKSITTSLKGSIDLFKDNSLSMALIVHNQALQLNIPKALKINTLDLHSEINGSLDSINIKTNTIADGVNIGSVVITGPVQAPKIAIAANNLQLTDLLSLNIELPINVELIEGALNYNISGQIIDFSRIEQTRFDADIAINTLSGEVDGIWLQGLNWQQNLSLQLGNITTKTNAKENLTIELIETFSPVANIAVNTQWSLKNNNFKFSASKLQANAFGGSFVVPNIEWPFEQGHSANVQLNSIDLEQVLALDKKQGIVVTGDISGQLPIAFDGDKFIIEAGELHNVSKGLIQVLNNPAVAELRASNSQLELAFDALQNLHYHQLSSAVSMADDGYMQLDTVIKGRNPDIDNDVNLNLNLTYDLLGLLESLSITQRFEDSITKGLQKNKE
jgi:hypothetical protein